MTLAVTYLHNLRHDFDRWTKGWKPGDRLVRVASVTVPDNVSPEMAAELGWLHFQRRDDDHEQLDRNEAPSMSIGDVVLVRTPDEQVTALAARFYSFERLSREDRAMLFILQRGKRTVAEMMRDAS